jgi:ATP-dependent protease ClpP protease subunit
MEIWYTLAGHIDRRQVQEAIRSINEDIYSKPVKSLRFLIASAGVMGEVDSGINLYTYLKSLPIEVETIAFGALDTAGTVIYLGGKDRTAVEHCIFYLREGRYTIFDHTASVRSHEEAVATFKRDLQELIYIFAKETGNDTELVADMLRRGKIMRVEEAVEFGIVQKTVRTLPLQQQEAIGFKQSR